MLKVKAGVTPPMLVIAAAAANVAETLRLTAVITSGTDGKHMEGSKHYTLAALDFRTSHWSTPTQQVFITGMRSRLGRKYQVVHKRDHIHFEYDPPK